MMPEIYPATSVSEFGVVILYQASREWLRTAGNGERRRGTTADRGGRNK